MKLYIKYMVSLRCKMIVQEALDSLNIKYVDIELGLVETVVSTSEKKRRELEEILKKSGLQLLNDKKSILIEKIKVVIIQMVHYSDELPAQNYSEYLSEKLGYDYTYLANTFSEVKGITIQHFILSTRLKEPKN